MNDAQSDVSVARRPLRTISEIRSFFRTNVRPIFFVGPTAFNLLGIDRWVRNFGYLVYYDSWDGAHPLVFTPKNKPFVEFESSEQINNYLLRDPEVQAHVASRVASPGGAPMIAMVFFDEETEQICAELGYNLILPPDALRRHLDSKIVTTRLGEEAGAPSVPNVIGRADATPSWPSSPPTRVWAPTWSCRQRTATRARRPSSSRRSATGGATPSTWSARSSRS